MTSEILRNEECNPNLLKKKGLELLDAGKTNEAVECFSKGLVYAPFDSLMRFITDQYTRFWSVILLFRRDDACTWGLFPPAEPADAPFRFRSADS